MCLKNADKSVYFETMVSSTECKKKAYKKKHVASNASTGTMKDPARNSQPLIPAESIGSYTHHVITESAIDEFSLCTIGALSLGASQSRTAPLSQQPVIKRQPAVSAPLSAAMRPHSVQPKGGCAAPVAKQPSIQSSKCTLSHQLCCHICIS